MKRRMVLAAPIAVLTAVAIAAAVTGSSRARTEITAAPAFGIGDLNAYGGDDWLNTTGGIKANRYSTLTRINKANVGTLKVAWQTKLGLPAKVVAATSEEAGAVAYKGTLFIP